MFCAIAPRRADQHLFARLCSAIQCHWCAFARPLLFDCNRVFFHYLVLFVQAHRVDDYIRFVTTEKKLADITLPAMHTQCHVIVAPLPDSIDVSGRVPAVPDAWKTDMKRYWTSDQWTSDQSCSATVFGVSSGAGVRLLCVHSYLPADTLLFFSTPVWRHNCLRLLWV